MPASSPHFGGHRAKPDRELTAICDDLMRSGDRIDTAIDRAILALVSRNLERIGDRRVNVSERTLRR